jgi:argininosuccinate lyase
MPQKRNPDVFELVRGRAGLIQSLPGQIVTLLSGLPSGYNRELQLLKQLLIDAFADLNECIGIMIKMLNNIRLRKNITHDPIYNSIFSTEEVNRLVKQGVPFRDAYKKVSEMVEKGQFSATSLKEYTHEGSIGNLCNVEIKKVFNERMQSFKSKTAQELVAKLMNFV